jgi:hypothetical protein
MSTLEGPIALLRLWRQHGSASKSNSGLHVWSVSRTIRNQSVACDHFRIAD